MEAQCNHQASTTPYVFNIQKFSTHDGPGIRTTVFFNGCPLRCLWCHNPEGQSYVPEKMLQDIAKSKGTDASGNEEGLCTVAGTQYPVSELIELLKKDILFYDQSGGGVTLSGGEVMTQNMDYVEALVKGLWQEGISVAVDTSGYAPWEHFARILPYVDTFLYDIKMLDDKKHQQFTGVSNPLILENLKRLSVSGVAIDLRLILLEGINTSRRDIQKLIDWLSQENVQIEQITLLPYHDFGREKYAKLKRACTQNFTKPSDDTLASVKRWLCEGGYRVEL